MSNMFEVGHRVVCVDTSCVERVLEKGKRYTIIGVDEVFVQVEGIREWFYYDRFERDYVNEEIEYNLKDKYGATLSVVRLYKDKTLIEISDLTDDILSVHLTDLDLICLYAMVGGLNGQQVIDSLKEEQLNTTYSDKVKLLLQKLQHSASKGPMWDLTDVPYLKLRLELVKRGLLGGDVKKKKKLKTHIKELEGESK